MNEEYIGITTLLKELDHAFHADSIRKQDVINLIINLPVADVVEVVRCKDCKHYDIEDFDGEPMCRRTLYAALSDISPDSFCSYEYIEREEKCGDCIHVEVCEKNPLLTEFSRENPAYCKKFMKAADVTPVVHGHWNYRCPTDGVSYRYCSKCLSIVYDSLYVSKNYCPNCGARMGGGSR